MPQPVKWDTIQDGEGNLRSAMRDLGLPALTNPSLQIVTALHGLSNPHKKGLDLIRVKALGSTLHDRHDGTSSGKSHFIMALQKRIASQSAKNADEIEYITIVRLSAYDDIRFVDEFWDHLISCCHSEGIYWYENLTHAVLLFFVKCSPFYLFVLHWPFQGVKLTIGIIQGLQIGSRSCNGRWGTRFVPRSSLAWQSSRPLSVLGEAKGRQEKVPSI